mmetsp:Transcript_1099/g.1297  ORF Transcript_1099/g.1297 Transcript_1099/m.1297 type:complete len:514 (-) Transcript_1099:490-2031(-)|eukprot:CAMPEP_0184022388 /NCGR_PEP_ID=MMETSP0954-20121128/10576_1 /TAXON_ID=627963 /ORGANISM="Aplanochytrium sp, Strain PBS07" /LENGTH=513 /DNA_ID=CAMNT_0026304753 /DNA_START=417 /DNA_END=1958 /DNA_ORIENTATION=+
MWEFQRSFLTLRRFCISKLFLVIVLIAAQSQVVSGLCNICEGDKCAGNNGLSQLSAPSLSSLTEVEGNFAEAQSSATSPPSTVEVDIREIDILVCVEETGSFPPSLARLRRLVRLDISSSAITSSIPEDLTKMTELESLSLDKIFETDFASSLPTRLDKLEKLTQLALQGNGFTGSFPVEIGQLDALTSLRITDNSFGGLFPNDIQKLARLTVLDLSNNNFGGTLPNWLFSKAFAANLGLVAAPQNSLMGPIPGINESVPISLIDLSSNQLNGSIPSNIDLLEDLSTLSLGNNFLSSSIPREIGNLSKLEILSLGNNELTGPIPPSLAKLVPPDGSLETMNVIGFDRPNQLTGSFPMVLLEIENEDLPEEGTFDIDAPTNFPTPRPTYFFFTESPVMNVESEDNGLSAGLKLGFVLVSFGLFFSLYSVYYYRPQRNQSYNEDHGAGSPIVMQMKMHPPFQSPGAQAGSSSPVLRTNLLDSAISAPGSYTRSMYSSHSNRNTARSLDETRVGLA